MAKLELYGTARCPYTQEMRDWLEWKRRTLSSTTSKPIPRPASRHA